MYIVRISDGLGNQMYQYAFAKKIQLSTGRKVYLDTRFINHEDVFLRGEKDSFHEKCDHREYGLKHFKISLPIADERILRRWKYLDRSNTIEELICQLSQRHLWPWQYRDDVIEKKCFDIRKYRHSTYIRGYFSDLQYYDDMKKLLQREFRLKDSIRVSSELRDVLKEENTVSIHIRRGDFTKLSRDISQKKYYPRALEKIEKTIKKQIYLVFSDDIEWVKKNMEIHGKILYISEMGFTDYEEFTIMKNCKHNIMANSTFSYWAAYLNENPNKTIVCPKRWTVNAIPKEWMCI